MRKKIINIIVILALAVGGGIISALFFAPEPTQINSGPVYLTEQKEITVQENTALQDSIEKVKDSIMGVKTVTSSNKTIEGSGIIVTADGLAVTLNDIIPRKGDFTFYVDGKASAYQILKRDAEKNLALIKIEAGNLKPSAFADFSGIKIGQRVFILGMIFSETEKQLSANEGVVKNFNQEYINTNILDKESLAGASLFNIKGELLGLSVIDSQGSVSVIPITEIRSFIGY